MNKYPTDEELELFIRQMEEQELYAPKYMKERILSQAFPGQSDESLPDSGDGGEIFENSFRTVVREAVPGRKRSVQEQKFQFLAYRLKIIAGMAAALFILMILPMQERNSEGKEAVPGNGLPDIWEQETEQEDTIDINGMLNESTRRVNRKVNSWLEGMDNLQIGSLFNRKDGGYIDEN